MSTQGPSNGNSVRQILALASSRLLEAGVDSPDLDAQVLLAHVLGIDRSFLFLRMDQDVSADHLSLFDPLVSRRQGREPIAYIIGTKGFWKFDLLVDENVLIPRPDTECIVEEVLDYLKASPVSRLRVLEMGTGSGAIIISLAHEEPTHFYVASDLKPGAAHVAVKNARACGVYFRVNFLCGDWLTPFSKGAEKFDLIVSNPPYISDDDIANLGPDVRGFEPGSALSGSYDGLKCLRQIIMTAPECLVSSGKLYLEMGYDQKCSVKKLADQSGMYSVVRFVKDLAGHDRVAILEKKRCD